jgi:hypothetical protein
VSGPIPSPRPDYEEVVASKTPTREMPAVKGDLRKSEWRALVLFVFGGLATLGTGFLSVRAIAQDAGSSESKAVAVEQKALAASMERHLTEDTAWKAKVERKLERQDEKQDLILDALRVPLWKRPEPEAKDGGR